MRSVGLTLLLVLWPLVALGGVTIKKGPFNTDGLSVEASANEGLMVVSAYTNPNSIIPTAAEMQNGYLYTLCSTPNPCRYVLGPLATGKMLTVVAGTGGNPIRIEPTPGDKIMVMTAEAGHCVLSSGLAGDTITLLGIGNNEISVLGTQGTWIDAGAC